jgi:glucose/arabinose dehydrogenase
VLSFLPGGGPITVEATGLRTAYGLAFWGSHLLVSVSGPDNPQAPDELTSFEPAGPTTNFGFPRCYGQGGTACAGFPRPVATFPAHSTPGQIAVKGDIAYVAEFGSAVARTPRSQIVTVDLRTGKVGVFWPSPVQDDVLGLTLGPDGNLYATLFSSGKVVRFNL